MATFVNPVSQDSSNEHPCHMYQRKLTAVSSLTATNARDSAHKTNMVVL